MKQLIYIKNCSLLDYSIAVKFSEVRSLYPDSVIISLYFFS